MTTIVTGRTFDHRDRLKQLGGVWNSDDKNWIFYRVTPQELAELKNLPGCLVTDSKERKPEPRKSLEQDKDELEAFFDKMERAREDKPTSGSVPPIVYGDDERYLNYFKDKNPVAFFGFSSLGEMVKFIDAIPEHKRAGARDAGWQSGGKWHGTRNMDEALRLARDGWKQGTENAAKVIEFLNTDYALQRRRAHSIAGGSVNVGRLLAGNPAHMRKRSKQPGRKVVTLFVENVASAFINVESLTVRAAIVAALADIMEQRGYSCEIVSLSVVRNGGRPGAQTAVTLKHAGEKLNIDDLAFALGHPSFLRRFTFACVSQCDQLRDIWESQGQVAQAFNSHYPPGRNEFYIKGLKENFKGDTLEETAIEILPFVKPDGLPLEIG